MAFPTESTKRALAFVLNDAQSTAQNLKSHSEIVRVKSVAGTLTASQILDYQMSIKEKLGRFTELQGVTGIGQFAKDQFDDQAFDVVVEFQAMLDAIQTILDWIRTNIPVSANGFVESRKIETDDTITKKTFTSGQTAGFRTELDLLIATID